MRHSPFHSLCAVWLLALACSLAEAQERSSTPQFDVTRFRVDGATLLPRERIDASLQPFVGSGRTVEDLLRARAALEREYARAGYDAVRVVLPEQEIATGEVVLRVIEAKVGSVRVEGNRFFAEENILRSLPALRTGEAPNTAALAADLRLANENPLKQTTVILRAGSREDDIDAQVRVADQRPYRFSLAADNTGTPETGDLRIGAGFQHANLFDRDHVLNLQYVGAPYRENDPDQLSLVPSKNVLILGGGYHVPLYGLGDSIDLLAGYANVDSGVVQGLFNVTGSGRIYAARYNFGLPRFAEVGHKLALGIERRYYDNDVTLVGSSGALVPDYIVTPLSLGYVGTYRGAREEAALSASVQRNLPGGANADQATFDAVRPGAQADYTLYRAGANFMHALAADVQLRLRAIAQYTSDQLVPGEQFGVGGQDSVRGLYEREILGDKGFTASVEVYSPDFGPRVPIAGWRMRLLAFYDVGRAWRNNPAVGEARVVGVDSFGPGIRVSYAESFNLRFDYGFVRDHDPSVTRRSGRPHFTVVWVF